MYEGSTGLLYSVKRSNNNGPFITIAGFMITGSDTTFVDSTLPSGTNRYRIDAQLPAYCTINGIAWSQTSSNIVTALPTGIDQVFLDKAVLIKPNPADKMLEITAGEEIRAITVYEITGKVISTHTCNGQKEYQIDISGLTPGIYFLKVNQRHFANFVKR